MAHQFTGIIRLLQHHKSVSTSHQSIRTSYHLTGVSHQSIGVSIEIYHNSTEATPRQSSHLSIRLILSAITRHRNIPLVYQSILSLAIPPSDPRGFAHSSCPWGRVFTPLSCPGLCPTFAREEVLNQSKSSIILKKARFLLCLLVLNN